VVGDSLTGNYTYADADSDNQGATSFRWLRGGSAIGGATASTYTLVAADSGQSITFEVTPVALAGTTPGSAVTSSGLSIINSEPTASSVSVTDDNGDYAVEGNSLTGSYSYNDVDNDIEGTSTFRWLRNGVAISGATASTYTLVTADIATQIRFEVTPVAATGITTGSAETSAVLATGTPPVVSGLARYLDANTNGINDAGDKLVVPFDQTVSINSAETSDFALPVSGDSFGSGGSVSAGPAINEITITINYYWRGFIVYL